MNRIDTPKTTSEILLPTRRELLLAGISAMVLERLNAILHGGEQETVEALTPPDVKKGKPLPFKMTEYNVENWRSKTKAGAAPWFKEDGDQWHVDWDAERKPFDMIVIHHSATKPETTADDIDTIQKKRLYVPRYRSADNDPFVKDLPIHSGHVIDGRERFIGYHHLVYSDAKVTTELAPLTKNDNEWLVDHVGWHSGKWSVNLHSLGICLVGDFSEKEPPDIQLRATAGLIAHYRSMFAKLTVTGHGDHVNTECPGTTWKQWRPKLLALAGVKD